MPDARTRETEELVGYLAALELTKQLAEHYEEAMEEVSRRWDVLRWLAMATRGERTSRREMTLLAIGMALERAERGRCGSSA